LERSGHVFAHGGLADRGPVDGRRRHRRRFIHYATLYLGSLACKYSRASRFDQPTSADVWDRAVLSRRLCADRRARMALDVWALCASRGDSWPGNVVAARKSTLAGSPKPNRSQASAATASWDQKCRDGTSRHQARPCHPKELYGVSSAISGILFMGLNLSTLTRSDLVALVEEFKEMSFRTIFLLRRSEPAHSSKVASVMLFPSTWKTQRTDTASDRWII
jgi:hypothetical protein